MDNPRIVSIEWAPLVGQRPRQAGYNARLSIHGLEVQVPLARLTTEDGTSGFGPCRTEPDQARALLGRHINELLTPDRGVSVAAGPFEFPLWDLVGNRLDKPVYQVVAEQSGKTVPEPLRVACYDTSLYIDDLHLDSDEAAAELIAGEARYGYEHNHRSFKIKVGRGARHMPLEAGTVRDISVIQAVRAAAGPDATIMIDANNGYNLNLAKRVLAETAESNLFWLEEPFHEDNVLYEDLRSWMEAEGLSVLIADGEGGASSLLMDWAGRGIIDVVQYDIFGHGFTNWLRTGAQLDEWGVRSAPHHYGRHIGNYVSGHLAAAIDGFTFVEWDEVETPGLDASAYHVEEGHVLVPNIPGFGLGLEEDVFRRSVDAAGWTVEMG